jgi:hypothetical protein
VVQLPGGAVDYLDSDDINSAAEAAIAANAPNAVSQVQYQYTGNSALGGPYVMTGLSVNAVLQNLLTPQVRSEVTFAEVTLPGPDGSSSFLTGGSAPSNLSAPSNYLGPPTPGLLPVFFVNGTELDYVRPLINGSDNAVSDDVDSAENGPLDLTVHTGPLLTVTAHASAGVSSAAKIGQPITFTARSTGDDIQPAYSWTINGVQVSKQQVFTHRFGAAGVYQLQVAAAGSDDSAGASTPLFVTIGTAHYKGPPKQGGSPTPTPTPTHTASPTAAPTPTASHSGTARPSAPASAGATSGPPATLPPSPPSPSSPPSSGGNAPKGQPVVHGRLIGQTVALLTLPQAAPSQRAIGASPSSRLSVGWRATALVGSIVAIMLLFAVGAVRELRWSRRLRSVVRPR